ncbi:MAG: mechanosensitive ion channel family protein [Candidatus Nanohaloarchaea archaeon]|nr:mechanosensitive ion channel family protein [Candidatus Nanohaloarchaea archaeon]
MPVDQFARMPDVLVSPAKLVATVIVFYIAGKLFIVPMVRRVVERRDRTVASVATSVTSWLVILVGVLFGLNVAGYGASLSVLGTVLAGGTVALGFAMKDTLGAAVAGVFILLDKPFEVGDWIEWNDRSGIVKEIGLRTTRVETFDNVLITVPNTELANNTIKNPVANDELRIKTEIGIGYDDDIDQAKEVVDEILNDIDAINGSKEPSVRVTGLGDSTVNLTGRYWIKDPSRADFVAVTSEVLQRVKQRFDEEGIDMPFPTRTIAGESLTVEQP